MDYTIRNCTQGRVSLSSEEWLADQIKKHNFKILIFFVQMRETNIVLFIRKEFSQIKSPVFSLY